MRGWRGRLLLGGATLALVGVCAAFFVDGRNRVEVPLQPTPVAGARVDEASGPSEGLESVRADDGPTLPLATSLAGTTPDGALVVDGAGRFVATPDALDFFDYYLSTLGERSLPEIVARLESEIRARVDPPDAALALLDRYLRYREEVRELVETEGLADFPLDRRLQWLRELRRDAFGAELAATLFAEEESRVRDALTRRRVVLDPDLDAEERAERIEALDARLPEEERERRQRVTLARRVLDREAEMRAEGIGETEVHAWRVQEFGDEAAARLADLDRQRADWDARVARYRAERSEIESDGSLRPEEAAAAVDALRTRSFEGPERVRIQALDRVHDSDSKISR